MVIIAVIAIGIACTLLACTDCPVRDNEEMNRTVENFVADAPVEVELIVPENDDNVGIDSLIYDNCHLNNVVDSLKTELFVAKYKLERIKYYNDIAAKGNNLKYLRGWINRVLNE